MKVLTFLQKLSKLFKSMPVSLKMAKEEAPDTRGVAYIIVNIYLDKIEKDKFKVYTETTVRIVCTWYMHRDLPKVV